MPVEHFALKPAKSPEPAKASRRQTLQRLLSPVGGVGQQLQIHTIGGIVEPAQHLVKSLKDHESVR